MRALLRAHTVAQPLFAGQIFQFTSISATLRGQTTAYPDSVLASVGTPGRAPLASAARLCPIIVSNSTRSER